MGFIKQHPLPVNKICITFSSLKECVLSVGQARLATRKTTLKAMHAAVSLQKYVNKRHNSQNHPAADALISITEHADFTITAHQVCLGINCCIHLTSQTTIFLNMLHIFRM